MSQHEDLAEIVKTRRRFALGLCQATASLQNQAAPAKSDIHRVPFTTPCSDQPAEVRFVGIAVTRLDGVLEADTAVMISRKKLSNTVEFM